MNIADIKKIPGPILILGASGFIGANLFHRIASVRSDVIGTSSSNAWRIENIYFNQIIQINLLAQEKIRDFLNTIRPMTIFDCVAYGSYSFEKDLEKIYQTNIVSKINLINEIQERNIYCYIHAGSSSEYGYNANAPTENTLLTPNSHYAVTKCTISNLLYFYGKYHKFPCVNLRLYSAYGPLEDSSRLIPTLIDACLQGRLPSFVKPNTSRDFIYIDDVCNAFIAAANAIISDNYGESFNIGTGTKTTILDLAHLAKKLYGIEAEPVFSSMPSRGWDTQNWYANPKKADEVLQWKASTSLRDGLIKTTEWYKTLSDKKHYAKVSKQHVNKSLYSVSAIVACYKDEYSIPIMVERLVNTFNKCQVEYEIILVNDGSPDNSEDVIKVLSSQNPNIIGITHARNFGSQAAFRSGMSMASKNACVLLDGDLQDPPELIEDFISKWRLGYDVVYGIRTKREASFLMQIAYKLFYRLFNWFSSIPIPHDAGDFSLLDKRVVKWLLMCKERDLFLRGLRAYVGFKQTGIPYIRPERKFGKTTNNFFKNIGWAKKGIFSFSKTPLNILSTTGVILTSVTLLLIFTQILLHFILPQMTPKGITTLMLLIMFFGSFTILAISLLGEYIAKIFEEVKARPHYIRKHIIKNGMLLQDFLGE